MAPSANFTDFVEVTARKMKAAPPTGYGYKADLLLGVGFYVDSKTGCKVLEKPVVVPSGDDNVQGYMVLYAYCSKQGVESLLSGQVPPCLPATMVEPRLFPSLASIAENFGAGAPEKQATASSYCVPLRVPSTLVHQVDTPGRDIWMVRLDQDKVSPYLQAAKEGDAQKVSKFLAEGLGANAVDEHGVSALMMAATIGSRETCQALLDKGANASAAEPTNSRTPLMFAAQAGHAAIVQLLLSRGADAAMKDSEGQTALMWAAVGGRTEAAKLLAGAANKDALNKEGLSAAAIAKKMGHEATLLVLGGN